MKKVLLFSLALGFGIVSCGKNSPKKLEKNVVEGSWKISLFMEDGVSHTNDFTGFTFTFTDNGEVKAVNSGNTITGTWSVDDNYSGDDSSSDLHFNLQFPVTLGFDDLNDDWHVLTHSDKTIELEDVSGGNGGTDNLTFTKI